MMNSYEATSLLLSKIKNLDPENASKIMGYLLIQDFGEEDLTCLALSPETVLHSLILKVKSQLGLLSNNSSTPSSPSPLNPIARPTITTSNPFSKSLPRLLHNGFDSTMNPSSPSSNSSWQLSGFPNNPINSPKSSPLLSYDNIRAGSAPISPLLHRRRNGSNSNIPTDASNSTELIDEHHLNDYLSFLNESSSSSSRNQNNNGEDMSDPRLEFGPDVHKWAHCISNGDTSHIHRRSYSASDVCFGSEEGGLGIGYKPCLYYARGFCKNGSSCKFVHGGFADASMDGIGSVGPTLVGSPSKFEGMFERRDEFLRLKAAQQQQRLTAHLMGGVPPSSQYNKYMNFLLQQQNDPQRATFMMEEEFHNLGLCQSERNEFLAMAAAEKRNSASRQIYLTFPADSTFKDEDVSEYFSKFGPVQDVRIPYQQKRMFGFVTFVYPETVKLILTKGNPHFICDSRVLVKPYKEKGKIPDKRQQHQQQQFERGEFSPCLSPSALESRDPFDLRIGARMLYNTQDMLIRRKLEEQAELQQAIELHERRLMNLHLPDLNERAHHHRHSLSIGSPLSSEARLCINQSDLTLSDCIDQEISQEHINSQNKSSGKSKEENSNSEKPSSNNTSMEQVLPDSLFASPKKSRTDLKTEFPIASLEVGDKSSLPSNSNSDSASL